MIIFILLRYGKISPIQKIQTSPGNSTNKGSPSTTTALIKTASNITKMTANKTKMASTKSKMAAWFVSNCDAKSGRDR